MSTSMTNHDDHRIRQRGWRESDVKFVIDHGTICSRGVILSKKDKQELIRKAKRTIDLATRLEGTFLAYDGEVVKTVFRANKSQQKRILSDQ